MSEPARSIEVSTTESSWKSVPLDELVEILDSKRKPITKRDRIAGPYPYYGATGVLDWVSAFLFDEPLVLIGEDGAKWGMGENSAFPISGKTWVNNHAHVLRPRRDRVLDDWLIYYLNAEDLAEFISGMTVPKLNQGRLREIPVPLPPLDEQKRIVAVLDQAFAALDRARAHAEANLAAAGGLLEESKNRLLLRASAGSSESTLGNLCEFVRGPFGGSLKKSIFKSSGYAVYEQQHAIHRRFQQFRYFVDQEKFSSMMRFRVKAGDLIMSCSGTMGKVAIVPKDAPDGIINQALLKLTTGPRLVPEFLQRWMEGGAFQRQLASSTLGVAIENVASVKLLKTLTIPVLSVPSQYEVVEEIAMHEARVNEVIGAYRAKLEDLQDLRQSLLQKAFSGQLA